MALFYGKYRLLPVVYFAYHEHHVTKLGNQLSLLSGHMQIGPVVNMCACCTFQHGSGHFLFNRRWMSSETLELVGISILDISLVDMEEYMVLIAEITGFLILSCLLFWTLNIFPIAFSLV